MSSVNPIDADIDYPDDDGLSMSDSTLQFEWISILKWNAEGYFAARPDVFVAGDHLIYPVKGSNTIRMAPDVYVVFGRPKKHRGSYKLWEEENIFPQVVIEVWFPSNTEPQMEQKLRFYEKYGAEEYYLFRPEFPAQAQGWLRQGERLLPVHEMNGFCSPRLNFTFHLEEGDLFVRGQNGQLFLRPDDLLVERDESLLKEQSHRLRADTQSRRAQIAENLREEALQRAEEAMKQVDAEKLVTEKLVAKLRELGIDPESI